MTRPLVAAALAAAIVLFTGVLPLCVAAGAEPPVHALMRTRSPTLAVEEKKKVPKSTAPETRHKGDDSESNKDQNKDEDDDDGEGWGACLGSCLGSMFSGSKHHEPEAPAAIAPAVAVAPAMEWRVGSLAMILPADTLARDVEVWDGPGGADAGHASVGRLRIGTEVVVDETHSLATGLWLKVLAGEPSALSGWVLADDVSARAPAGEPAAGAVLEGAPQSKTPWIPPKAITMLSVSGFWTGPSDIMDEYEDGGFMFSLVHLWRINSFAFGPTTNYGYNTHGKPQFDFETPTRIDVPISSTLQIFDVGLHVGQYLPIGSGQVVFHYGLGPALFLVRQDSRMHFSTIDPSDSSVIYTGERTETLSQWRLGGDVALGVAWRIQNGPLRIGFLARGFAIPWESNEEKSLSLDFIDDQAMVGFNVGVTFGYEWH